MAVFKKDLFTGCFVNCLLTVGFTKGDQYYEWNSKVITYKIICLLMLLTLYELQFELAAKNVEIDQLKQQTAILQTECETVKSSTTEMSNKPTHEANQKFHSSVEHQPQHLRDQCIEHDQKVKHLEAKLESERQNHAEKVKILQVWYMYTCMYH